METENKGLIDVRDCPCDGCKAKPCGHPARCVKFTLWLNKTVDAVEVVHGRWIDIYDGIFANPIYKCSICGNSAPIEERYPVIGRMYTDWSFTNYCPNCGAKMDGDGNGFC